MTDTFCILPWIHIYANADGTVHPCCIGDYRMPMGNVQRNTLEEIWNNSNYKSMRKAMLSNVPCKECNACYSAERNGGSSFRQHVNKQFEKHLSLADNTNPDGSLNELSLKYLDVRWSNICNLKCRSCSATYSSSWAKEDGRKNIYIFAGGNDNDILYKEFEKHFDGIEEFYFAGGEPLLMDKHYEILNYLIENNRTDVKLRYSTNCTSLKYKQTNVIDLWKHFSNVQVFASLDAWGPRAEYIRSGTQWIDVENNIKEIRTRAPHVDIQMSTVVSALNVSVLSEFVDYLINNDVFDKEKFNPQFYVIVNPDYYTFSIFTDIERDFIIKTLKYNMMSQVQNALFNVEYNEEHRNQFIEETRKYDLKRSEDFNKTFPELHYLKV